MTILSTEPSCVWFDIDDTLVDFSRNSLTALGRVYRSYGLERRFGTLQAWLDAYHHHNALVWRDYAAGLIDTATLRLRRFVLPLTEAGMDAAEAEQLARRLDPAYLDILAREPYTVAGAAEILRLLRERGYRIGVLSNGFDGIQQLKLQVCGLQPLVDHTVLSEAVGAAKPSRAIFAAAMAASGIAEPTQHLMVGDNPDTDIAGALGAGWQAIHLGAGSSQHPRVSSLLELAELLPPKKILPR